MLIMEAVNGLPEGQKDEIETLMKLILPAIEETIDDQDLLD